MGWDVKPKYLLEGEKNKENSKKFSQVFGGQAGARPNPFENEC